MWFSAMDWNQESLAQLERGIQSKGGSENKKAQMSEKVSKSKPDANDTALSPQYKGSQHHCRIKYLARAKSNFFIMFFTSLTY